MNHYRRNGAPDDAKLSDTDNRGITDLAGLARQQQDIEESVARMAETTTAVGAIRQRCLNLKRQKEIAAARRVQEVTDRPLFPRYFFVVLLAIVAFNFRGAIVNVAGEANRVFAAAMEDAPDVKAAKRKEYLKNKASYEAEQRWKADMARDGFGPGDGKKKGKKKRKQPWERRRN
jgi:hypothetical protein